MPRPFKSAAAPLLAALLAAPAPAQSAPLPPAGEILRKVEARIGDPATRAKLRTLAMRGAISVPEMPGAARFEEYWLGADRVLQRVDWSGGAAMTQGTTGAFSWSTDPALGITIREGDEQAAVRRQFDLGRRAEWTTLYESAETQDLEEVDGRDCFKLAMKPRRGDVESWFVDRETHDLRALETTVPDPTGGTIPVRFVFGDHREVQGIRFPHLKTMKAGSVAIAYRYESIEPNAALKPEQVAPPADVLEAVKDPSKRAQQAPEDPAACRLEELVAQPTLSIRLEIPADQVSRTLAVVLPEVGGAVAALGAEMTGPPFSRYHRNNGRTIDLEAGIPVKRKVEGKGRVKASELPAGRVAVTWHVGPYDSLPKSYARLESWLKAQPLKTRGGYWEIYWTDPGIEPDPARWRTKVLWPVD